MICPNCGSDNKAETTFCGKCGNKLPDISNLFNTSDNSFIVFGFYQQKLITVTTQYKNSNSFGDSNRDR